jgi:hypothetical protein
MAFPQYFLLLIFWYASSHNTDGAVMMVPESLLAFVDEVI